MAATALVPPGSDVQAGGGNGVVSVGRIAEGRFDLLVDSTSPGLVVVSESDHRGWRARVDDREAPIVRADHAVIGVPVPAGRHRVSLRFAPRSVVAGGAVSLMAVMLLVFGLARKSRLLAPGE